MWTKYVLKGYLKKYVKKYLFLIPLLGFKYHRSLNVASEQVKHNLNIAGHSEDCLGQPGNPTMLIA